MRRSRAALRKIHVALRMAAGGALVLPICAAAHDSPEHVIEALTEQLEVADNAARASLVLYRRALGHRALGRLDLAAADLADALRADPDHLPALVESSRVELALGRTAAALAITDRALELTRPGGERAALHMVRARIHDAMGNSLQALADCERAFEQAPAAVDWYLTRSRIQARAGRHDARMAGLKDGFEESRSVVLETEWIEAMIDAGESAPALERIEPKLAAARWKSSWLIRRARARLGLGDEAAAQTDLRAAIAEIDERLRPERPDLTLLLDRGVAHALLGDRAAGIADLQAVKSQAGGAWLGHWRATDLILDAPLAASLSGESSAATSAERMPNRLNR